MHTSLSNKCIAPKQLLQKQRQVSNECIFHLNKHRHLISINKIKLFNNKYIIILYVFMPTKFSNELAKAELS